MEGLTIGIAREQVFVPNSEARFLHNLPSSEGGHRQNKVVIRKLRTDPQSGERLRRESQSGQKNRSNGAPLFFLPGQIKKMTVINFSAQGKGGPVVKGLFVIVVV